MTNIEQEPPLGSFSDATKFLQEQKPLHFLLSKIIQQSRERAAVQTNHRHGGNDKDDDVQCKSTEKEKEKAYHSHATFFFCDNQVEKEALSFAIHKIASSMQGYILHLLRIGLKAFSSHMEEECQKERTSCAICVQSMYRGYMGRCAVWKINAANIQKERRRRRLDRAAQAKRSSRCISIQRVVRGYMERRRFAQIRRFQRASLVLQKAWSHRCARVLCKQRKERYLYRNLCSIKIQSCYRCFRAKVLLLYLINRRHRLEKHYSLESNREAVVRNHFIRHGAAFTIQRKWKSLAIYSPPQKTRAPVKIKMKADRCKSCCGKKRNPRSTLQHKHNQLNGRQHQKQINAYYDRLKQKISPDCKRPKTHSVVERPYSAMMEEVNIIQRAWRCALARRKMWRMIKLCYKKFINEESYPDVPSETTPRPFWHNIKTGKSIWTKPYFFGRSDFASAVVMPKKDRSLQITCDFCGKASAKWHDVQGCESYCDSCNIVVHSKGRQKGNDVFAIPVCSVCEFQSASKHCYPCNDMFCDTCFFDIHRGKGMMSLHPYRKILRHCMHCREFAACVEMKSAVDHRDLCRVCYEIVVNDHTYQQHPYCSETFVQCKYNEDGKTATLQDRAGRKLSYPPFDKSFPFSCCNIDFVPSILAKNN